MFSLYVLAAFQRQGAYGKLLICSELAITISGLIRCVR